MRLTDLDPEWEGEYLVFVCPTCPRGETRFSGCIIQIPTGGLPGAWSLEAGNMDVNTLTLTPSIWHHCKTDPHFFIRNGEIQMA